MRSGVLCLIILFSLIQVVVGETTPPVAVENKILSSSKIDIDQDHIPETVEVIFVKGTESEDNDFSNPGPLFYQGEYILKIKRGEKLLSKFSLNKALGVKDLSFRRAHPGYDLIFDDYNDDGQPDFTIGSGWVCGGMSECRVFTIDKLGRVNTLNFKDKNNKIGNVVYLGMYGFSKPMQKENGLLTTRGCCAGSCDTTFWKWNGKIFEFVRSEKN